MIDVRKKLQDELNTLERELRVELPKEILRAREHGDLSENAEYHGARESLEMLRARANVLRDKLSRAVLMTRTDGRGS